MHQIQGKRLEQRRPTCESMTLESRSKNCGKPIYIMYTLRTRRPNNKDFGRVLGISIKLIGIRACEMKVTWLKIAPDGRSHSTPQRRLATRLNKFMSPTCRRTGFSQVHVEHSPQY